MSGEHSFCNIDTATNTILDSSGRRTAASYELELTRSRCAAERLEKAHALDAKLLREKDEQIRLRDLLSHESDHRLLNEMQMIVSLLSLQSRKSKNTEVAFQLTAAADRIATIGRVHRRLHSFDGVSILSLKQYLHDLCRDYSTMLACNDDVQRLISVEGPEIDLPASTGIPLGFIVNELITNAVKHGSGAIAIGWQLLHENRCAISVTNDGPALPEGFEPAACTGMGMKIIRSLVSQIGGKLKFGTGDNNHGVRFTVIFPLASVEPASSELRQSS
jgi:two-component sensor histidine kinase